MSHNTTDSLHLYLSQSSLFDSLVKKIRLFIYLFASERNKPYQESFDFMLLAYAADEKRKLMIASSVSMRFGY